uniref:Uncharacterized protein n=1 Tax=Vespula pensylvanica TaxID=30213 RepID=A0A834KHG7_VESPE|nr:hypothetical protein H0235_014359 [Vespula pensylvanica]
MAQTLSTSVSRPQSLPWKPCSPRCSVQNNVKAFARRRPDSVLERIYDRSHGSNETQFDWAIYVENGTSNGHGSNANCCLSAPGTRGRANRVYDRMGTAGIAVRRYGGQRTGGCRWLVVDSETVYLPTLLRKAPGINSKYLL